MYSILSQVPSFVISHDNFQIEALIEHGIYKIGQQKVLWSIFLVFRSNRSERTRV